MTAARRRRSSRAFTIVELLTVISVIGILAATAAPTFIELMRDRRVGDAATSIADLYRSARSRAMGRGSATIVRWNANAAIPTPAQPEGHFVLREAVSGPLVGFHAMLPATSCFAADWSAGATTSRRISVFDERLSRYHPAQASFTDGQNAAQTQADVCYTPRGRTFIRTGGGSWAPLTSVPAIRVTNPKTSFQRFVIVPPNGAARLETRMK